MGKGSPKKVESIPYSLMIPVFASEGMLKVAHSDMFILIRRMNADPDNVDWQEVSELHTKITNLTRQYLTAIRNVERYMQNG